MSHEAAKPVTIKGPFGIGERKARMATFLRNVALNPEVKIPFMFGGNMRNVAVGMLIIAALVDSIPTAGIANSGFRKALVEVGTDAKRQLGR
jgi:hypothetical protein